MTSTLLIGRDFTMALSGPLEITHIDAYGDRKEGMRIFANGVTIHTTPQILDFPLGRLDSVVPRKPASPLWMERLYSTEWIR